MSLAAIIAGAGSGTRLGADLPKALVPLDGEALIVHAVRGMNAAGVADVVVTIPPDFRDDFARVLTDAGLRAELVDGGATRQASVANGLAAVDAEFVLVHDAARALTTPAMIRRVVAALEAGHAAVVPALPVTDTVKSVGAANVDGTEPVVATLNRAELRAMQTPQGFAVDLLVRAHEAGAALSAAEQSAAPDDAALVELLGEPVVLVPGDQRALKITTPFDLAIAQLLRAGADETEAGERAAGAPSSGS